MKEHKELDLLESDNYIFKKEYKSYSQLLNDFDRNGTTIFKEK